MSGKMTDEIQNDAYVIEAPEELGTSVSHMVVVDIADPKEKDGVRHQIVCLLMGGNNALEGANDLNKWKAQVTIQ